MRTPQEMRGWNGVLNTSMILVSCLYIAVGFFGYLKYGDQVAGSITLNLPVDELWVSLSYHQIHYNSIGLTRTRIKRTLSICFTLFQLSNTCQDHDVIGNILVLCASVLRSSWVTQSIHPKKVNIEQCKVQVFSFVCLQSVSGVPSESRVLSEDWAGPSYILIGCRRAETWSVYILSRVCFEVTIPFFISLEPCNTVYLYQYFSSTLALMAPPIIDTVTKGPHCTW